jgi:hypothetical protein
MLKVFTLDDPYQCVRCATAIQPGKPVLAGSRELLDEGVGICEDCRTRYFPLKADRVIPVKEGGKYILIVPKDTPLEAVGRMAERLSEWFDGDETFLFVQSDILLVKVDG